MRLSGKLPAIQPYPLYGGFLRAESLTLKSTVINAVDIAQKQRHLLLLSKVKSNQPLSKPELDELSKLEEASKTTKKQTKKSSKRLSDNQVIKGQKEAAEYVGVDERTIRRWVKAGMSKTEDGEYIKNFLRFYKRNEGTEPSKDKTRQQEAEADYKTAKARLLEIELKIRQGELVYIEEIEKGRIARIQAVKRGLLGLGRKIAKRVAGIKNPRKIESIISDEVRQLIERFARD